MTIEKNIQGGIEVLRLSGWLYSHWCWTVPGLNTFLPGGCG